jgi:phosphoserine aminotransferase
VEFPKFPEVLSPKADGTGPIVVADMSSNILSRRIPVKNYHAIFFGAQKNLGSTGIAVAIVKKSLLPPTTPQPAPALLRKLGLPIGPIILSYETIAKNNSLYNTLSILDVFIAGQVLKKLLTTYPNKVDGQEAISDQKAGIIYQALESRPDVYKIVPDKSARSRMNICFRVTKVGLLACVSLRTHTNAAVGALNRSTSWSLRFHLFRTSYSLAETNRNFRPMTLMPMRRPLLSRPRLRDWRV